MVRRPVSILRDVKTAVLTHPCFCQDNLGAMGALALLHHITAARVWSAGPPGYNASCVGIPRNAARSAAVISRGRPNILSRIITSSAPPHRLVHRCRGALPSRPKKKRTRKTLRLLPLVLSSSPSSIGVARSWRCADTQYVDYLSLGNPRRHGK